MNEALAESLRPLARTATQLNLSRVAEGDVLPVISSRFGGGEPYAEVGEAWPVCPTCKAGLAFICQIDMTSVFHRKPEGVDLFSFYYCWECGPWGLDDEEKGTWVSRNYHNPAEAKAIKIKHPEGGPHQPLCRVETRQAISFPDWDELAAWSKQAEEICGEANVDEPWAEYAATVESLGGLSELTTFLGGYPRWIQGEAELICDLCQNRMDLLAQIDTEDEADIMWGDVGCVYLFYCPLHPTENKFHLQYY